MSFVCWHLVRKLARCSVLQFARVAERRGKARLSLTLAVLRYLAAQSGPQNCTRVKLRNKLGAFRRELTLIQRIQTDFADFLGQLVL